ncbi:MAG: DUF1801 domain-containing protein [Spirochaeta sp.]|nr:DUF1801 domain-containing protein [Spirochaeta sp.]
MAQEPKTKRTDSDPRAFLERITDEQQKADSYRILSMMEEISGEPAQMWGDSIIGFGSYSYRYASGQTGTWMRIGFSPRSRNISLYIMDGCLSYAANEESDEFLDRLGKHKTGKACLYIKRLADIDEAVLRELITRAVSRPAMGEAPER